MVQIGAEPAAIRLESVSKVHGRREGAPVEAVHDLDLSVPAGQICGLVGPNGAGKTTVLRIAAGLTPPTTGRIFLNGFDLANERDAALQQFGAVVEGSSSLQESLSIEENLAHCGRKGSSERSASVSSERLLRELDLWERRGFTPSQLSQGTRRLVAVACASMAGPPIFLIDEPAQYLDIQVARRVETWIKQQARENGAAVLLATRQPDVALTLCDRVAIMRHGRLVADRPQAELRDLLRGEYYQIKLKGRLEARRSAWFGDLRLTTEGDETVLSGVVADQAALQGIIGKVRNLGIPLISVTKIEPGPEQVLTHLMFTPLSEVELLS